MGHRDAGRLGTVHLGSRGGGPGPVPYRKKRGDQEPSGNRPAGVSACRQPALRLLDAGKPGAPCSRDGTVQRRAVGRAHLASRVLDRQRGRSGNGEGLVALGPLAIACTRFDAGIPVEVESAYLPMHLLDLHGSVNSSSDAPETSPTQRSVDTGRPHDPAPTP
ncbi:Imm49 family immunity protein [Streptomyces sp. NPDC002643]